MVSTMRRRSNGLKKRGPNALEAEEGEVTKDIIAKTGEPPLAPAPPTPNRPFATSLSITSVISQITAKICRKSGVGNGTDRPGDNQLPVNRMSDKHKNGEREMNSSPAAVFHAHQQMLNDPVLKTELRAEIPENLVSAILPTGCGRSPAPETSPRMCRVMAAMKPHGVNIP